jgi:hypothetical protein
MSTNHISQKTRKIAKVTTIGLISLLTFACAGSIGKIPGQESAQVNKSQITRSMNEFEGLVGEINEILAQRDQNPGAALETINRLNRLEVIAENLGAGKRITNHIQLEENIHQLGADIRTARSALEVDPPNFYWAERVSRYCEGCHAFPR